MLLKNSIIFGATTLIKGFLSFLVIAVFTRLLNADQYGDYAIVIILITFFDMFGFMWLRHTLMRHITDEHGENDKSYFTNTVALYAAFSIIVIAACFALSALHILHSESDGLIYELLGVLVFTEAMSNLAILMARLRLRNITFAALSIAKPLLALIFGAILVQMGFGVQGALMGVLASSVLATIWGLARMPDLKTIRLSLINTQGLLAIAAFGLPLIVALSIQSAVRATDRLLLDGLIGGDIVGLYSAAQDVPHKLLTIIISSIHLAAYPMAVKALDREGEAACREQLKTNICFLLGVTLPACVAIGVLAPQLAEVFLGEEFRPFAIEYFWVFSAISALNCLVQYYFILSFNFTKQTKKLIAPFTFALVINAGVAYITIPIMGAQGAMIAAFLAYAFLLLISVFLSRRAFPMPFPPVPIAKITASAAIMGAALWAADFGTGIIPLTFYVVLGGAVYAGALWILNPLDLRARTLHIVRALKKKAA